MSRDRLLAAMSGLLVLMATACGGSGDGAGGGADGAADEAAGPTRSVQHAMGTTEISGTPQRVVVLDTGELDSVLALGVTPVGAVRADEATGPQAYLAEQAQGVERVGTIDQPNLEAIAALQPDLILSNKVRHEELYDKFSGIAPTVFAESVGKPWKDNFRLAGEALGKQDQAERILADYRRKAEQVGQRFNDPGRTEVSMVRFMSDGIRLYGEGSFIGTILDDAGFARPRIARTDETFVEVSREQLSRADGDLLFHAAYGQDGASAQGQLTAGPLWQRLGAVSRGDAHKVSDDLWYLGIGPIAADLVLDDLARYAPRP
ncbi:MAG: ABC transporter substrate-binding protein [Pseudonocardiaceae bacterium]|nr:ABC transporter substrate-binding protein [Pseudonocardiaceae bacterium]